MLFFKFLETAPLNDAEWASVWALKGEKANAAQWNKEFESEA